MSGFDVIIVGGGSAGAVLAARLAEHRDRSVLLIEAGPEQTGTAVPAGIASSSFFDALEVPGRVWASPVARQARALDPTPYLRGRGVGGSSAINGMVVGPGIADDYDDWVRAGATGWGWDDLAPWFSNSRLVLSVAGAGEVGPLGRALLRAIPNQAGPALLTRRTDGRRTSVADVYLELPRPTNLMVMTNCEVQCLLIDGRRVVGVRLRDGSEIGGSEVIVAAGAIGSPVLLLRSGVDTPGIGDNLSDHAAVGISLRRNDTPAALSDVTDGHAVDPHSLVIATVARMSSGEEAADLQVLALEHLGPGSLDTAMLLVGLMTSYSRGTVRVDGSGSIHVALNLLDDQRDTRRMHRGIEQVRVLLAGEDFQHWSPVAALPSTDDELIARLGGFYHAAGTCALGTVVDPACRMRGYTGLRVCDASIMPSLPRANPHLTVVAVAERLASMINEG